VVSPYGPPSPAYPCGQLGDSTGNQQFSGIAGMGELLIARRNPLLAEGRRRKRTELLAATEEAVAKITTAVEAGRLSLGHRTPQEALHVTNGCGAYSYGTAQRLEPQDLPRSRAGKRIAVLLA
jgi:hypothetical protein